MTRKCVKGSCGRRKSITRTASKSLEKKLIQKAKELKQNPYLVLPEYNDRHSKRYFRKQKRHLSKVEKYKDDVKKLKKLSKKKELSGAVAGTLLLSHSEKAPYLAAVKTPEGEVKFAQRGKASKEKLIAAQHFDNPVLRLMGIKDIALNKKIHVYSWDDGFISKGKRRDPPEEFVDFIGKKIDLKKDGNHCFCKHLSKDNIEQNKTLSDKFYLKIYWKSADMFFSICEKCASKNENTIFKITRYLIEKDISKDFDIEVVGKAVKKTEVKDDDETFFVDGYLSGGLSDLKIINKNKEKRIEKLKTSDEKILVLNGESYGKDTESFIKALKPKEYEKIGLEYFLNKSDKPLLVNDVSPNDVLEIFWDDYGLSLLESIVDDSDTASKLFDLDSTPSKILATSFKYKKQRDILSELPDYKYLSPLASFADHIAKTYKASGKEKAINEIKKKKPDDTKGRSLAYGFLLALGKGKEDKWKYKKVEVESGEFLKEYALKLLDSSPEDYHKNLGDLMTATGSSEKIVKK
ncbi:MAG: hypothetical protein V5A68_02615 [Candidatus Thermoplasmatota archaeon]